MNKNISIVVSSIIAVGVVGYGAGYALGGKAIEAKYADRMAMVNIATPVRTELHFVNGRIAQVKGSTVVVDKIILSQNPFASDAPATRDVVITDKTKITKILPKDMAVYNAEVAAMKKKFKDNPELMKNPPAPPSMFVETPVKISDLKAGETVVATANADILLAPSFEATKLQITMANPVGLK